MKAYLIEEITRVYGYDNFEYKPFDLDFEIKAHDEYLKLYFNEETK